MPLLPEERETKVKFTPSRVDGIASVSSVTVLPDSLELETLDGTQQIQFRKIGRRQESLLMHGIKRLCGIEPSAVMVADRNWFRAPQDRYFRFYTDPRLTVYMPSDDSVNYTESVFFQIQAVVRQGGYATFDLG